MNRAEAAALARAAKADKSPPLHDRFWSKVDRRESNDCWPWTACVRKKSEGYGAFWFQGKHIPASRMAFILTFGEQPAEVEICHHCDNPRCCNPAHLFAGTRQMNNQDKVDKLRHVRGSRVGTAKLTEEDVKNIRKFATQQRQVRGRYWGAKALAEEYGISVSHIYEIARGEHWECI